jgi:hypothetical protein
MTNFMQQDKEFIKSLRVGDIVDQVSYMRFEGIKITRSSVKRISPTGQITLENGDRFKSHDRVIGYSTNGSIVSPEHAAQARLDIVSINRASAIRSDIEVLRLPLNKRLSADQFDATKSLIAQLKAVLEI